MSKQNSTKHIMIPRVSVFKIISIAIISVITIFLVIVCLLFFYGPRVIDSSATEIKKQVKQSAAERTASMRTVFEQSYGKIQLPDKLKEKERKFYDGGLYPNTASLDVTYNFTGDTKSLTDEITQMLSKQNFEVQAQGNSLTAFRSSDRLSLNIRPIDNNELEISSTR